MTNNSRFPQLDPDAPEVPKGLEPKPGVEFGCGAATCRDCYAVVGVVGSIQNPARVGAR